MRQRPARSRRVPRWVALAVLAGGALLASASRLDAHDFWLIPGAFPFADGTPMEVLGQTSTRFPTSQAPVAVARVARAALVSADGEVAITDVSHRGTSLLLRARPTTPGQRVVAVDLQPRASRQTWSGLLRYLQLEGAASEAARITREGGAAADTDSLTRTDAKYAKTLVDVGTRGPRAFSVSSRQTLEFVPQRDPAGLAVGDTLRLALRFRGGPVAGAVAHAGAAADSASTTARDVELTADAAGVVRLPLARPGLWNVRAAHVVRTGPAAWETHWATFVFRVGQ